MEVLSIEALRDWASCKGRVHVLKVCEYRR
jgi:hypothetical protein